MELIWLGSRRSGAAPVLVVLAAVGTAAALATGAAAQVASGRADAGGNASAQNPPHAGVAVVIRIDPLLVRLNLSVIRGGKRDDATITVTDHSQFKLSGITAALVVPQALKANPAGSQSLGHLAPGTSATAVWTVCARTPGSYPISATAWARDAAGNHYVAHTSESEFVVTTVMGRC